MSRFKAWWRNENYDREHMRRYRERHPELSDLPDALVATLVGFAWFSLGEAMRDMRDAVVAELPVWVRERLER